jgi:hypothetical protein
MSPTSPFNVLDLISTGDQPTLWIFGYGSLIWNPGFGYESSIGGYAPGYVRRFYQGNSHARGSKLMVCELDQKLFRFICSDYCLYINSF